MNVARIGNVSYNSQIRLKQHNTNAKTQSYAKDEVNFGRSLRPLSCQEIWHNIPVGRPRDLVRREGSLTKVYDRWGNILSTTMDGTVIRQDPSLVLPGHRYNYEKGQLTTATFHHASGEPALTWEFDPNGQVKRAISR
ncbi:MAG: hypothetical protein PHC64_05265 [Candidatus Gastranaerophilales bacterium]|nr:hypothetical protein [Candidatus Gastranaerophilales bacterium]